MAIALIILFIAFVILVFVGFVAILVAPEKAPEKLTSPFNKRYFAHRGLHTRDGSIPENSVPAFDAACEAGYGIELDLRLTKDGQIVVSHDDNLERVCGTDISIENSTYQDISKLTLGDTEYKVPLFTEVLDTVGGRVPLIVEIKVCKDWEALCFKTMETLAPYEGDYALESFDPGIVKWVKNNMPGVLRGQLASRMDFYDPEQCSWLIRVFLSRCLAGLVNRPNFIAYEVGPKPWPVKLTKLLGAMHITWTSRPKDMGGDPEEDARKNDAVIFEHYTPPTTI